MRDKMFKLAAGLAAVVFILMLADIGSAQRRRESRNRAMNKAQVKAVIDRVENRVDNFVRHYDRSLDRSRLNGTKREDWLNGRAGRLESATDELSREFQRRDRWIENKDEVRRCLDIASDIDRSIRNRRLSRDTENIWSRVRYELNTLADIYNLPKVGSRAY